MEIMPSNGLFPGVRRFFASRITHWVIGGILSICLLAMGWEYSLNYFRAHQARRAFADALQLQPGVSTMADARRFVEEHRLGADSAEAMTHGCTESDCILYISYLGTLAPVDLDAHHSPFTLEVPDHLGLRPWALDFRIFVKAGKIVNILSTVEVCTSTEPYRTIFRPHWWWHELILEHETEAHASLPRQHPARIIAPGYSTSIGRAFWIQWTQEATPDLRQRAAALDLSCLTRLSPCAHYHDIAPQAWRDYCSADEECRKNPAVEDR